MTPKEIWDVNLEIVKILGACGAFIITLWQYRKAQAWKRKEFIAAQMKEFEADERIRAALTMLDWTDRFTSLYSNETGSVVQVKVTNRMLCYSVFPNLDGVSFDDTETSVRDCFDRLFDALGRLQTFVDRKLITIEELRPYVIYWVRSIAGDIKREHPDDFYTLLHYYIVHFEFCEAGQLIQDLGRTIEVEDKDMLDALNKYPKNGIVFEKLPARPNCNKVLRSIGKRDSSAL